MGSQKALQLIKKKAIKCTVLCVVMALLCLMLGFVFIIGEVPVLGIVFLVLAALLIVCVIIEGRIVANPKRMKTVKKNPQALAMLDELYEHIIYEDKSVIYSEDIIANKANLLDVVYFRDITNITENSASMDMITYSHTLDLFTKDNRRVMISVYGKGKKNIDDLVANIYAHCPNLGENKYTSGANAKVQ